MKKVLAAIVMGVIAGAAGTCAIMKHEPVTSGDEHGQVIRDIRDVPTMSGANATLHRENRYENLHSVAQILALPTACMR